MNSKVSEERREYYKKYYQANKERMRNNSQKRYHSIKEGNWKPGKVGRPKLYHTQEEIMKAKKNNQIVSSRNRKFKHEFLRLGAIDLL